MLKAFRFTIQTLTLLLFLGLAGYVLFPVILQLYIEVKSGATIQHLELDQEKLILENINFEHNQTKIQIKNITVHFDPRGLKNKQLKIVQIEGINGFISLNTGDQNSAINIQDLKEKLRWGVIPIEIKNAQLVLDHPATGLLPISFEAKIHLVDFKDQLIAPGELDFVLHENQYVKSLQGKLSTVKSWPSCDGFIKAQHLKIPEIPAPLNGHLSFQYDLGSLGPIIFDGSLLTTQDEPLLSFNGKHHFPNTGFVEMKAESLQFGPQNLKLADYWGEIPKQLKRIKGNVIALGKLSWNEGRFSQTLDLNINDGSAELSGTKILGLKTQMKFTSLIPLQTAPRQRIFIEKIESAIPLTQIQYDMTIDPKNGIHIHHVAAKIDSGYLQASNIKLDPLPASQEISIRLDNIPLSKLVQLLSINGLTAQGKLSGTLPITWHADRTLDIRHTTLSTQDKGHISYQPPGGLANGNISVKLVTELFQDFQYDTLHIFLEKPAGEDLSATLDILGKNPKVQKGRPVHLKINASGKLISLLETTWMTLTWDLEGLRLKARNNRENANETKHP